MIHPLTIGLALFIIMNPIGNVPVFLAMVDRYKPKKQRALLARELLFALSIIYIFALFGGSLLSALHLDTNALGVSGGILLFLIALGLIFPRFHTDDGKKEEPFLVPIAIPLTAGPGTLVVVMLYSHQINTLAFLGIVTAVWALVAGILIGSTYVASYINKRVLVGIKRLGGFLLSLIAVDMVVRYLIRLIAVHGG
jgi:multiple antibiotic resistance protein